MSITSKAGQRITSLLDENSFVEIGALVKARATDFDLKQTDTPSDGVITGYGVIEGKPVYVYSQDASVLNGSIGEMHAKKIVNLYELAMKTGAPVIGLIESAGLRLQEATDALNAFGEIYRAQVMASGVVPQISAVFGNCGGGLSVVAGLSDFTFMEETKGRMFVNAPNAVDGNEISKCDTSSAKFQSEEAGSVDYVGNEDTVLTKIRELISLLPVNCDDSAVAECEDDLNRDCSGIAGCIGDTSIAFSQLADSGVFFETKADYAKNMVTGFIRMDGMTVGCIANRTEVYGENGEVAETYEPVLTPAGCHKAEHFVKFCDAFDLPILTLTNVKGFSTCKHGEKRIAGAAAKLTYAFANATVPKVNVIIGQAYGSAYSIMNSKALGADMTFAWPNAEIGAMDAGHAAQIMYEGQGSDVIAEKTKEYAALQTSAVGAASRGYVDTVIEAEDTRKYVISAFEMLYTKNEDRPAKKHGTV